MKKPNFAPVAKPSFAKPTFAKPKPVFAPKKEPVMEKEGPVEVQVYDSMSPGRSALEAHCRSTGQSWAILSPLTYHATSGGGGSMKVRVLVGTVYEIETDDHAGLDTCLEQLVESLNA